MSHLIILQALSICLFLLMSPTLLVLVLWQYFNVGTWLLAVTAFCIEVVVKVLVTVLVYGLFMWDSHCQDGLWESLDDWVYYIRAVGNVVEFCFAVFLFFNGGWILLFESGGTIRACMMLIHAYFNIWCEARFVKFKWILLFLYLTFFVEMVGQHSQKGERQWLKLIV